MLENALIILLVAVLFVLAFILVRTILFGQPIEAVEPTELPTVDGPVVAEHLAAAIRYATVSHDDRAKNDYAPFLELRRELERMYPRVHATLKVETVNRYSLIYTWTGKDPSLAPVLLAAHMDVVPVDPATRDEWKYAPFEGRIAEGCVWGRGALDMKNTLIAVLEGIEALLRSGYQPERTLLLGFGHDEEISGQQGAAQIAGHLQAAGIHLAALLDEGGVILPDGLPGFKLPTAVVGVSEKGYLSLELTVEGRGGHSSMPPRHTAIGLLARALTRVENNPMPVRLDMAMMMFRRLGAFLPFGMRALFANSWLFGGALSRVFTASPRTNAMVRTTTALTLVGGGVKDNLLPAQAKAVINFRLLPGDRVADVVKHVRQAVDDEAVQLHIPEGSAWEASPISPFNAPATSALLRALGQVYQEVMAVPYLVAGATDSRYYTAVCDHIYRFSPYVMQPDELSSIHSTNEHIRIEGLARMVQFYIQLIKIWTDRSSGM